MIVYDVMAVVAKGKGQKSFPQVITPSNQEERIDKDAIREVYLKDSIVLIVIGILASGRRRIEISSNKM